MARKTGWVLGGLLLVWGQVWGSAMVDERVLMQWCHEQKGKYNTFVTDHMRCDCLTEDYAIDLDIVEKWPEAIGRSLATAQYAGKKPGVGLVYQNEDDRRLIEKARQMVAHYHLPVRLWEVRMKLPSEEQEQWNEEFTSAKEAFAKGKYSKAIGILTEILQKDPTSESAWLILGQSYYGDQEPLDAVDCYKKALGINPDNAQTHFLMGMAYEYAGWTSEAYEQYKILRPLNTRLADELYNIILK